MSTPEFAELALRTAVNTAKPKDDQAATSALKEVAVSRAAELLKGQSTGSSLGSKLDLETQAISLAIEGLTIAYKAISNQIEILSSKRLSFDSERLAGYASFLIPKNKEETDLSKEENAIRAFIHLADKSPIISKYLGVSRADVEKPSRSTYYSVLPFYKMSQELPHPVASKKPLESQRTAINLFFRSALPESIADIDNDFQTDSDFVAFWESVFQKGNYLNNLRAPRFIMMALSNLLWNLLHPVDPKTGYPLSKEESIDLCRDVELYLNQILNNDAAPYLDKISNKDNELISFVRKIEIHTKALRLAYIDEMLHELNIDDVVNAAHRVVRIMDQGVFKLIYKKYNPVTRKYEPNPNAAEDIAYTISYLNQLLSRNPQLVNEFQSFLHYVPSDVTINRPALTVMDLIIILSYLPTDARHNLYKQLKQSVLASTLELEQTLQNLDSKFIKPIRRVSKKELGAGLFNKKREEVARLTAKRLTPLVTLVVEGYRIEVDTDASREAVKQCKTKSIKLGIEQVQDINHSADKQDSNLVWELSPFIEVDEQTKKQIDQIPHVQYRMTELTKLLDFVDEVVSNYRHFLSIKSFQSFLNRCLNKVSEECESLEEHIQNVDLYLSKDEAIRPMTSELNTSLDAFNKAAMNLKRQISEPDFTEHEKEIMVAKLEAIEKQYAVLFDEKPDLTSMVDSPRSESKAFAFQPLVKKNVATGSVIALHKLVQSCYNALSYQSKQGRKGNLLKELMHRLTLTPDFTEDQIRDAVLECSRITSAYRETWYGLFQAKYGETRSAQALVSAIKSPEMNNTLSLANIIFNKKVDPDKLTKIEIVKRLDELRSQRRWKASAAEIGHIAYAGCR